MRFNRELRGLLKAAPEHILEKVKDGNISFEQFIEVLCEAIKIKDVELSTLALQSLKKSVENVAIDAKLLQQITETVVKIEFTSTESELVEEGYHQAIRVCRAMIKCDVSHLLTNGSVSEIIIFCFRVVNSKLVKWLRSKASRTLISITKTLFKRLQEFPEDLSLKPSYQIRLRLGGASSQSTFKELADQPANDSSSVRIINERNQSYNLAFINDFLCYLASLINPNHEIELNKNIEDKILLGLDLLKVIFNEAGEHIGQKSCLIHTTRNNICYNIVSILKTSRSTPLVSGALNLAIDIFVELRHHLKYQFEAFLELLIEMLNINSEQTSENGHSLSIIAANLELRSDVLNAVLELFRSIDHFPHELYYNYDCDPYSSNIYRNLIEICSKNCFQNAIETRFSPILLTSLKCLLTNLDDIHRAETNVLECFILNNKMNIPRTCSDLIVAKLKKQDLEAALETFNARPKDGIQAMLDKKLIDNNQGLVQFLKDNPKVDKKVLGEFLSKRENEPIREAFITSLDFNNLRIDEALRSMLEKFRLPGESQLIERILNSFSAHYREQNKGFLLNSDDTYLLAYAIIHLNTVLHNKNAKVVPMTCDQFGTNMSSHIQDRQLLDQIYTNIRDNEIVLPDEQVGLVRQRYLWKCKMAKSDRIDALYWKTGIDNTNQSCGIPLVEVNKMLFDVMWSPTLAVLSFIFEKIDTSIYPELSRQIVDQGFIKYSHLCAPHQGHYLDDLVAKLCKFTTDLNPILHNHSGQKHLMSDKNSLAAMSLLSIIRAYANCMRTSWTSVVKYILQWYCSKCIDDVIQVEDFALQQKVTLRMREIKKSPSTMNHQSSTFLRSVYTYFAGQPTNEDQVPNGTNCAPSAIQVLIQTIQDAEYCPESLVELIAALTTTSIDGDPEEIEDAEVFKLEIFTQVILNNKEQASTIWPRIRGYFARQSSICGRSCWLGERIISAAFRVAIQFKPKPEVFSLLSHVIATLDAEIVRGDYTFVALTALTELHSSNITMDAKELESCFNQVIFPFLDRVIDGCDTVLQDRTLNRAINLLSKIFLKHLKLLKELPTFGSLWYAILDTMEKYIKANSALRETTFELVKNMVLVMDNEQCMSIEMKDQTRTKFMFWEFHSGA